MSTNLYVVDGDRDSRMALIRWAAERGSTGRPFLSGRDFVEELPHLGYGVVLIDVQNAGGNGFDVIEAVTRANLACPVIAMTAAADTTIAVAALKRGAVDFLMKPIAIAALHEAVASAESIMEQRRAIFEQAERDRQALARLSQREREVLASITAGKTNKAIAADLGISVRTVEAYRASVIAKLGADTAAGAVAISVRYETAQMAHTARIAISVGV